MSLDKPFQVVYKSINGSDITTDVYVPLNRHSSGREVLHHPVVIDIHGGAFMLGHSGMVSKPQLKDCLDRGWIILVPNHRLCPQVKLHDGPIADCRDLLAWVHNGKLDNVLASSKDYSQLRANLDKVIAFGTSSGGTLALCLGYDVPHPVAAIFDLYGPVDWANPFWREPIPHLASQLPPDLSSSFMNRVYDEHPVPTTNGVSLEGQSVGPDFADPRQAFALTQIASGTVLDAILAPGTLNAVDPLRNIGPRFPPTFIVHGKEDNMVPGYLSRKLYEKLKESGVVCGMLEIPGEGHTFAAKMEVGGRTWEMQRKGFDFLEGVVGRGGVKL